MKSIYKKFKHIGAVAATAGCLMGGLVNQADAQFASDALLATNFVVQPSSNATGTLTNLALLNYGAELPDGYFDVSRGYPQNGTNGVLTLQVTTVQLPFGFTGWTYTNGGYVYTNQIANILTNGSDSIVPQTTSNQLYVNFALLLDDASKVKHLPAATNANNVVSVPCNVSISTNIATGAYTYIATVPISAFQGAKWAKPFQLVYNGTNGLWIQGLRIGYRLAPYAQNPF